MRNDKKGTLTSSFESSSDLRALSNLIQEKTGPSFEGIPEICTRQNDVLRTGNFMRILKNLGIIQTARSFKSYSLVCLIVPRRS